MQDLARDLFGHVTPLKIKTEGIKYAGSKLKLIPFISDLVDEIGPQSVLDGFSGTTRVSQALAQKGYEVTCADISLWSYVMGTCYLLGDEPRRYSELIQYLNSVPPRDGWFTEHYGGNPQAEGEIKHPWQRHNTQKLDAIREEIDKLNLSDVEKSVALTSLMLALDRVDNTLGHFASYLKGWSKRSFNKLVLEVPKIVETQKRHTVLKQDIFKAVEGRRFDLAYLDPPYGSNNEKMPPSRVRYASYYHIWTTVCANDRPDIFGAARRREDSRDAIAGSVFEDFRKDGSGEYIAVNAIKRILSAVEADHIILSYSSGGRATADELREAIDQIGELVSVREIDYKRNVMAGMRWTNDWVRDAEDSNLEFLFHIAKR